MYEPYLTHHGIKGQKWGVRRFQNEDGSLTEYGKKYNPNQPSEASQPMFDARVKYAAANSRKDRKQATKEFKDAKKLFKQEIKVAQKEERTISKEIGKLKKLKTNDKGQYINKNGEVLSEQVLGAAQNYETLKKIKRESGNKRLNKVQYRRDYISLGDKYVRTVKYKRYNEVKPLTKHDKNLLIAYSRIQKLGFENMHEPYLTHHGIKGQRWGIRRFQKKDGTLTAAGKRRADDSSSSQNRPKMSTKKKVAIGIGVGVAAAGTGVAIYMAMKHHKLNSISPKTIDTGKDFTHNKLSTKRLNLKTLNLNTLNSKPLDLDTAIKFHGASMPNNHTRMMSKINSDTKLKDATDRLLMNNKKSITREQLEASRRHMDKIKKLDAETFKKMRKENMVSRTIASQRDEAIRKARNAAIEANGGRISSLMEDRWNDGNYWLKKFKK